jgi:Tol biopolymer transport system component
MWTYVRAVVVAMAAGCGNASATSDAPLHDVAADVAANDAAGDASALGCDLAKPFGQPTALSELNTTNADAYVRLSPDEQTAYVASIRPGGAGDYDIYVAARPDVAMPFGALSPIGAINTANGDDVPTVTADGLMMVFSGNASPTGPYDLYMTTRTSTAGSFGPPSPVAGVNDPTAFDHTPYLLPDGMTLYFASTRGTAGVSYDLYRTTRPTPTSAFAPPTKLTELSTGDGDSDPVVSPDGLTLYFTSYRTETAGSSDIWVASRASTGDPFGTATNVAELNTAAAEWPTWISNDGCRMYFGSDRGGGMGGHDLWVATRPR